MSSDPDKPVDSSGAILVAGFCRMYANIQRYATAGERVLVVSGQGHTAIFRDLLQIDGRLNAGDIALYLVTEACKDQG